MAKSKVELESALPSLALVFGYIAIKELQDPKDRVDVLSRLGYGYKEIAKICGLPPGRVAVMRTKLKTRKKRK